VCSLWISYKHLAALRPGWILSANFRNRTLAGQRRRQLKKTRDSQRALTDQIALLFQRRAAENSTIRQVRFRIILPVIYLIISGGLLAGCFLHLGHSVWCQYFLNSMFPSRLIGSVVSQALVTWGIVRQDSAACKLLEEVLLIPAPFLLTLIQYYLIGLVTDKLITLQR